VEGTVTIAGSAGDSGGGRVAGVEVSTDGGLTWHPAVGTEAWTYEWQVPRDLDRTTILSRAADDSVNLETPGAGVTVRGQRSITP
jgi:hypothetical protein